MKFKALPYVVAALAAASSAHGDVNIPDNVNVTGNTNVSGNASVNGTLTVQAAPTPVVVTPNNSSAGQTNPVTGTNDGTSTAVRTVLGGTEAGYTTATGGGAQVSNNGDVTLNSSTGSDNTVSVSRVTEVRVYNADQGVNAGQPIPNTQSYYLIDASGAEIPGSRVSVGDLGVPDAATAQANFEELVDGDGTGDIDFTGSSFDSARTVTPLANTGGNLSVGGNASVTGQTTTNGIDNSGQKITNLADGTAPTDAVNKGQVDAADTTLQNNIDAEAATRAAADTTLQNNIDSEAATRAAADTTLQTNIDTEAATRAAADTTLQNNIDAEAATRAAADTTLQNNITTEVNNRSKLIRSEGTNADGNEIVHIGAHSLVTQELGGQQLLSAQDAGLNPIDIRVTGGSNLIVDGNTTTGSLNVTGQTVTNGIDNSGARISNVGNAVFAGDAVNLGQMNAAGNALRNEFQAADRKLQRDIDKNTRGIAMVAAMTNTTVAPGKTHGFDFNVSQFQSETGFSFGYANRINENVQLHAAAATTQDFDEAVGRVGVSVQF